LINLINQLLLRYLPPPLCFKNTYLTFAQVYLYKNA
jgi:hypothetical protein